MPKIKEDSYLTDEQIAKMLEDATLFEQSNNIRLIKNMMNARRRVRELEDMYLEMKELAEPLLMDLVSMWGGGHEAIRKLFALLGIHPSYAVLELPPKKKCRNCKCHEKEES